MPIEKESSPNYFVEFNSSDAREGTCSCCGSTTRTVWGYVYRDDDAFAVYYFRWSRGHEPGMLLSWGGWGEGAEVDQRRVVGLGLSVVDGKAATQLVRADTLPGVPADLSTLGRVVEPAEAKGTRGEWFGAYSNVLAKDPRIGVLLKPNGSRT